jgi:uncharacterized cupin superfamily protein
MKYTHDSPIIETTIDTMKRTAKTRLVQRLTAGREVDGPVTWIPETREVAIVLEGSVRIEVADGEAFELGVGDLFSLPPGRETTWHVTTPSRRCGSWPPSKSRVGGAEERPRLDLRYGRT